MTDIKPYRSKAEQLRKQGDMRDMAQFECEACRYDFWAPVASLCPRCRSPRLVVLGSKQIKAPRV